MTDPSDKGYHFDPELDQVSDADRKAKPSELDYIADPKLKAERNRKSIKQAIIYALTVCAISIVIGVVIVVISQMRGGPICDAGVRTLICSRTFEILFPVLTGAFSLLGVFGAMIILYQKWKKYDLWMPWFGVIWFLIPWALTWITGFGTMAIIGQ